jgi:predicted alpha/beta-fold hydrolase
VVTVHGLLGGGERHLVRDLFGALRRARLRPREAELWLAVLHRLARERR